MYPNGDKNRYVLKNASFKIEKGQLCVIVGTNGSGTFLSSPALSVSTDKREGKSTLMKLILRLYDPAEGSILINGIDIKTMKAKDLRACISTLFQDFTLFPFSVSHPSHPHPSISISTPPTSRSEQI